MSPFDLDQGKISVRVAENVYLQLLADIEDFEFKKSDGKLNANAFYNKLLPNLILYRARKRRDLRNFLEKNFKYCTKDGFQDKLFNSLDDLFDSVYFDDYREYYHRQRVHFRLRKSNIISLQKVFDELEEHNTNKTSYIRNLFNEYAYMKKDKREQLCFQQEYILLNKAISNGNMITCICNGEKLSLLPYRLELNYMDDSLNLFSVDMDKKGVCRVLRLCSIRNIYVRETENYVINDELLRKIDYILDELDYTEKRIYNLNRIKIK